MIRFAVPRGRGRAIVVLAGVALVALLLLSLGSRQSAGASTTTSADHIGVAASDLQILNQNQQPNANSSTTQTIMSTTFKTSTVEDLVVNVSAECGLYTAVGAKGGGGNTSSQATGIVTIHLELDGNPLPTTLTEPYSDTGDPNASPPTTSNGPVVYCDRQLNLQTVGLTTGQLFTLFMNTRSANSFQWFALNVGNGMHTLTAVATLEADTASSTSGSTTTPVITPAASALIGQRTMEVYPAHLANSATF